MNFDAGVYSAYQRFLQCYEKWRTNYERLGRPAPNAPVWEGGRLLVRMGYPFDGWATYIIAESPGGYDVLT